MIVDPRPALRALLEDSPNPSGGIWPIIGKQGGEGPQLVYNRIGGTSGHTMEGPVSMARARFQIDAYALDQDEVTALANAVKERLDGFSGSVAYGDASPQASVKFYGIFYEGREIEGIDPDSKMFRIGRTYEVNYLERP